MEENKEMGADWTGFWIPVLLLIVGSVAYTLYEVL
jgi:hypothetical protein